LGNSSLRIAFRFDNEDLDANRNGYMTKRQRVTLNNKRWEKMLPYTGIVALLAFMFVCGLTSSGSRPDAIQNTLSGLGLLLCIFGPLIVGTSLLGYREWRRIKTDLYKGDVSIAMGLVRLDILSSGKGSISYKLDIAGTKFDISKDQLLAIKNGERYRVFFVPNSKVILSVEPM
jgi:hypothetical protein